MKLDREKKLDIVSVVLVSVLIVLALALPQSPSAKNNVSVIITDTSGGTEFWSNHNIITDIGERYDRNALGFANATGAGTVNATMYVSIGNATPATSLTKLTTEATTLGSVRATGTVTHLISSSDWAYNVTITFTFSGTIAVQSAGLHWNILSGSDLNMYAVSYLTDGTYHQFTSGSTLTIKWIVVKNDN